MRCMASGVTSWEGRLAIQFKLSDTRVRHSTESSSDAGYWLLANSRIDKRLRVLHVGARCVEGGKKLRDAKNCE